VVTMARIALVVLYGDLELVGATGAAPGGTLGVGRFEFDDVSPQFPATSDTRHGHSIASPALVAATVRLEVVTVRLRGTRASLLRRW